MTVAILHILKINLFAAACIFLVLLLSRRLKAKYSARWKYVMWLILAAYLLIPLDISSQTAVWNIPLPAHVTASSPDTAPVSDMADAPGSTLLAGVIGNAETAVPRQNTSDIPAEAPASQAAFTLELPLLIFCIWITAASALSIFRIISCALAGHRLRRFSHPLEDDEILALFSSIRTAQKLSGGPELLVNPDLSGPLLTGLLQPRLYLPEDLYTLKELELVFSHELCHYRKKDIWYKLLLMTVSTLYWFNPALHLMVREADRDLEFICDEKVAAGKLSTYRFQYNRLLLKTAASAHGHLYYVSASLNDGAADFKQRVLNIMAAGKLKAGVLPALLLSVFLASSSCLIGCTSVPSSASDSSGSSSVSSTSTQLPGTESTDTESLQNGISASSGSGTQAPPDINKDAAPPDHSSQPQSETLPSDSAGNQGITLSDGEPKPSIAQLSGQTGESAEVQRTVELYAGEYKDSRSYGDNPNCPDNWCSIIIYNVTASSFDFFIQQYQPEKQSSVVVFNPHRAIFIDDGQRAAYYGKEYDLFFSFENITDLSVSGFETTDGCVYSNNSIPGHEFS